MAGLIRTDSNNADFRELVAQLDQHLKILDGKDHLFYSQFNKLDKIKNVIVVYIDNKPVGCGAFKEYNKDSVEIKRMFVRPEFRGQGTSKIILSELEKWANGLNYSSCILETGKKQIEAIRLYKSAGYELIPNYGQYKDVKTGICMKKNLHNNNVFLTKTFKTNRETIINLFRNNIIFKLAGADDIQNNFNKGGNFYLTFKDRGTIHGRFLEISDDEIVLEWSVDGFQRPEEKNTIVQFMLRQDAENCIVELTHKNISGEESANAKRRAWNEILDEIEQKANLL